MNFNEIIQEIVNNLQNSKAQDIVSINISEKSDFADSMIIASGQSHRHVSSITSHLLRYLKNKNYETPKVEGMPDCNWILIDIGDVIVHIFRPEIRMFYNLEKMWQNPDLIN